MNHQTLLELADAAIWTPIERALELLGDDLYDCQCPACRAVVDHTVAFSCSICGYSGDPLALPCVCSAYHYDGDYSCSVAEPGADRLVEDCQHGQLTCPICEALGGDDYIGLDDIHEALRPASLIPAMMAYRAARLQAIRFVYSGEDELSAGPLTVTVEADFENGVDLISTITWPAGSHSGDLAAIVAKLEEMLNTIATVAVVPNARSSLSRR